MPSFSNSLEQAIHAALAFANERRHAFATLEHLSQGARGLVPRCAERREVGIGSLVLLHAAQDTRAPDARPASGMVSRGREAPEAWRSD